jgi:cytochrome P450
VLSLPSFVIASTDIHSSNNFSTLIFAADHTTSTSLARILHVLALHPKEQAELRKEIILARVERGGADFSYDEVMALPYLDAVVRESMRLLVLVIETFKIEFWF